MLSNDELNLVSLYRQLRTNKNKGALIGYALDLVQEEQNYEESIVELLSAEVIKFPKKKARKMSASQEDKNRISEGGGSVISFYGSLPMIK